MIHEPSYLGLYQLLDQAIQCQILHSDPNHYGNILVYKTDLDPSECNGYTEGWCSESMNAIAQRLANDSDERTKMFNAIFETYDMIPIFDEKGELKALKKSDFYKSIISNIKEEESKHDWDDDERLYIDELSPYNINVTYDAEDFKCHYSVTNPMFIDSSWFRNKIIITPKADETGFIDKSKLINWILTAIFEDIYMLLRRLIIVFDNKDYDWLYSYSSDIQNALGTNSLPTNDTTGITWGTESMCVINLSAIKNYVETHKSELKIKDENDFSRYINQILEITIAKELRHIQQAFPYYNKPSLPFKESLEEDAETYGTLAYNECSDYIGKDYTP